MGKEVQKLCLEDQSVVLSDSPDVWIDFSSPKGTMDLLKTAKKTPVVSGTTGLDKSHLKKFEEHCKRAPLFWASNMSLGVAALRAALQSLKGLEDFEIAIEEIHHSQKKDSPSGTALTLKQDLEKICNKNINQIVAIRGGGVRGQHRVFALGADETLIFEHTALSRAVFAHGAIRAAKWIVNQEPGVYGMDDLLKGR